MPDLVLHTDRLIIRPVEMADLGFLWGLYGDPTVMRYYDIGQPYDPGHVEAMVDFDIHRRQYTGLGSWLVIEKESNQPIGHAGIEHQTSLQAYTLYYLFVPGVWGKGYATECVLRIIAHGFMDLHFDSIKATAHLDNKASIRVLEKAGMHLVKHLPNLIRNLYAIDRPCPDRA